MGWQNIDQTGPWQPKKLLPVIAGLKPEIYLESNGI
jgi:hypothetical protein